MRFGISLPPAGPLSEPAAVVATAVAAEQLGYSTAWSSWLEQLAQVAVRTDRLRLGLVWGELPGSPPLRPGAVPVLGDRWCCLVAPSSAVAALAADHPDLRVFSGSVAPPPRRVKGWAPLWGPELTGLDRWRGDRPDGVLVLRFDRAPDRAELERARRLQVDEVVVGVSASTLDEQLQAFAAVAEALSESSV